MPSGHTSKFLDLDHKWRPAGEFKVPEGIHPVHRSTGYIYPHSLTLSMVSAITAILRDSSQGAILKPTVGGSSPAIMQPLSDGSICSRSLLASSLSVYSQFLLRSPQSLCPFSVTCQAPSNLLSGNRSRDIG